MRINRSHPRAIVVAVITTWCSFSRVVLWCRAVRCGAVRHMKWSRTALSDLEVDHEDIEGKKLVEIPGFDGKVEVGASQERFARSYHSAPKTIWSHLKVTFVGSPLSVSPLGG